MTKRVLAELIGYSEQTLTEWQAEGMPILRTGARGESNEYDTKVVIQWMLERAARKIRAESARDEFYRVQTEKVTIEIAEKKRELVPAADIESRWALLVLGARKRLLSMPGQLAELLEMSPGQDAKRAVLTEELDKALRELSEGDQEAILEEYIRRILIPQAETEAANEVEPS